VPGGIASAMAMIDRPLRRLFWRVADALDYLLTLAKLHILDALAGPAPETAADHQRKREREQIAKAFPALGDEERAAKVFRRTERVRSHD
jgi:hypothetical protein